MLCIRTEVSASVVIISQSNLITKLRGGKRCRASGMCVVRRRRRRSNHTTSHNSTSNCLFQVSLLEPNKYPHPLCREPKMSRTMTNGSRRKEEPQVALVIRACDMCRKKKIRCEIVADTCAQCLKYKTPCHFTPVSMKRTPRRSPKDKYLQDLEQRLKRMEEQLKCAMARQPGAEHAGESSSESSGTATPYHLQTGMYHNPQMELDVPMVEYTSPTEDFLQPMDFGQPIQKTIFAESPEYQTAPLFLYDNPHNRNIPFSPLPPVDKGLALIEKSLRGFNSAFPIFDRETFLVKYQNPESNLNNTCWWACLNVVLALSHRFTGTTVTEEEQDLEAWGYFQNALSVSDQLITMGPSVQSVQALIGLALLFLGSPNQGPVSLLISSAIKLAQRMKLHRSYQNSTLPLSEIEQRKQIFWSAYTIDKDLSLTTGQPPAQDDDDMDVEMPSESPSEESKVFAFRIRLARIQGQIYKHLCSVRARRKPSNERVMAARKLEKVLQMWKAKIPEEIFEYHQENGNDGVYSIILQLSYFNAISTIYNSLPNFPMNCELSIPQHPEITYEARKAINLLDATPRRNYACLWAVFPIYVTASTTLLTYTLSKPTNASAALDLKLSQSLLRMLVTLARVSEGQRPEVAEMYRSSVELFEKARMAIETSKKAIRDTDNKDDVDVDDDEKGLFAPPEGQKESVEDFLKRMERIGRAGYEHFDLDLLSPKTLAWVESHNIAARKG
ncbi:unnamed protein product [Periconia digitata]|uniref:Zn(2)-C6 fungal-type domain-containing protein n=1 Tax=Periconia digitata TaxID=1303443 RepID=A0A9W4USA4_9PLEO|nr:unnamed protein product [Periconia digitata]